MPLVLGNPICCPATTYSKKRLGEPFVQSEYQFALDWDHMVQLAGEKGRFICVEKPLIYYRVHEALLQMPASKTTGEPGKRQKCLPDFGLKR